MPLPQLDSLDLNILHEFDYDARLPFQEIAHNLGISKQLLRYRIQRLKSKGFLKAFYTIIDFSCLGLLSFRVYFRLKNPSRDKELEIVKFFIQHPSVFWVARLEGVWDLEVAFAARNFVHFNRIFKESQFKLGAFTYRHNVSMSPVSYHFKRDYLLKERRSGFTKTYYGFEPKQEILDSIDLELLRLIAQHARLSNRELAHKLKIGFKTAEHRLARLIERGIVKGTRAHFDIKIVGREYHKALVTLVNLAPETEAEIHKFCSRYSFVVYITEVLGAWNLEIETEVKDQAELLLLMRDLRHAFPENVVDFEVVRVTREEKLNYFPVEPV